MNSDHNALADALNNIALNLSTINFSKPDEILVTAEKALKHIDQLSQKLEIPSVRALTHWMLLNTEQHNDNHEIINKLAVSGSYFNWIEILASLLETTDAELLNPFYESIETPNWFVKPSALLLKDLKSWLETIVPNDCHETNESSTAKQDNQDDNENITHQDSLVVDPSTDININHVANSADVDINKKTENASHADECFGNLSLELDELIMSLIDISSTSEDVLEDSEKFNNKLEQLIIFSKNCSYHHIAQIGRWCQRNLDLFARNKSQHLYHFVESGECWSWIEILSFCINEPEELTNLSSLSTEFNREEWIEPINREELQDLLLFLKSPKQHHSSLNSTEDSSADHSKADVIDHIESSMGQESSTDQESSTSQKPSTDQKPLTPQDTIETNLSFTWDEDTHPELLAAYFKETPNLVIELSDFLKKIKTTKPSKEDYKTASRTAHTIKGSSAVLGITALSSLAYQYETLLDHLTNHHLSDEQMSYLIESANCLDHLFDAIKNTSPAPSDFAQTLTTLEHYAENLDDTDDGIDEDTADKLIEDDSDIELSMPELPDFIQQNKTPTPEKEIDLASSQINKDDALSRLDTAFDIKELSTEIEDIVMSLSMTTSDPENPYAEIATMQNELQRLDLLAEISGYSEISNMSQWCQQNLRLFEQNQNLENKQFLASGESWLWIELISAILQDPEEKSYLAQLSQELMRQEWQQAISQDDLKAILLLLNTIGKNDNEIGTSPSTESQTNELEVAENTTPPETNNIIKQEALSISLDKDIHPELLSTYFQETPDQISEAAQLIYKISKGKASKEDHQHAARIVHTIKGSSGVVGIKALAQFTHKLEDILEYSINHQLPKNISTLLIESADCLEDLFEAIQNKGKAPQEFPVILSQLEQYAKTLENADEANDIQTLATPDLPDFIKSNKAESVASPSPSADDNDTPETSKEQLPSAETHIRVPIAVIDKLLNLAGELVISSTQVSDKIQKSLSTNKQIKSQDPRVHKLLNELSHTISQQERNQTRTLSSLKNSNFDSLEMDTYNELHSIAGLLTESILDKEEIEKQLSYQLSELTESVHSLELLNSELSQQILNSRMISINTLTPKLERIVRQTCRKTGKKAELAVSGNEINIDTDILNKLADPLLHLLRNSIDHGIEQPKDRKLKSKYETGRIHLSFSREGKYIQMELKDDGAGIDANKIYHQAQKMGLIDPEKDYTEKQILQLILHPGFSTQKNITDISGRGVGMDVVNNAVKQLRGTLDINSKKGEGTSFTIKVPLTLVTSGSILVGISGDQVAIPSDAVEQLYHLSPNTVIVKNDTHYIQYNDQELPIISLATLLDLPAPLPDFGITNTLLIVKGETQTHAVYIDQVIQSREIVIKSLEPWINADKGIIGACHLPDGGVAPVVNLLKLLGVNEDTEQLIEKFKVSTLNDEANITETIPQILVVDDSLSNRKALSLIIEQTEYKVLTAVDGLDALHTMNENDVDVVFTDLEMPRMNGLELTQSIRAWDAKKHTPVVMITSRTTSKHRQLADKAGVNQYLTKPVIAEVLLESLEHWLNLDSSVNRSQKMITL